MEIIPMPKAGEMMKDGIVVEWLVEVGDHVNEEQPIAVISTDKVEIDFESPMAGTIIRLLAAEGETVQVGEPLLELDPSGPS